MFESQFVDQIQIVGYFHEWDDDSRQGDFIYWNNDEPYPVTVPPKPRSGSGIDGSKVVHAANVYHPDRKPPLTDKNKQVELRYNGRASESWTVYEDGVATPYTYPTDELRSTIVFRARCFESDEAKERFNDSKVVPKIPLPDILDTLRKDIEAKTKADLSSLGKLEVRKQVIEAGTSVPPTNLPYLRFVSLIAAGNQDHGALHTVPLSQGCRCACELLRVGEAFGRRQIFVVCVSGCFSLRQVKNNTVSV